MVSTSQKMTKNCKLSTDLIMRILSFNTNEIIDQTKYYIYKGRLEYKNWVPSWGCRRLPYNAIPVHALMKNKIHRDMLLEDESKNRKSIMGIYTPDNILVDILRNINEDMFECFEYFSKKCRKIMTDKSIGTAFDDRLEDIKERTTTVLKFQRFIKDMTSSPYCKQVYIKKSRIISDLISYLKVIYIYEKTGYLAPRIEYYNWDCLMGEMDYKDTSEPLKDPYYENDSDEYEFEPDRYLDLMSDDSDIDF